MRIAELTAKIERLSADDYNMVIMLVERLSENTGIDEMRKLSEDALVEELSKSIEKSDTGATQSALMVSDRMRKKYGIATDRV